MEARTISVDLTPSPARRIDGLRRLAPGVLVCGLVALAAQFLADHYGAPAMLMALLMGLALHFLVEDETRCAEGVAFGARTLLRVGVACLGARISFELLDGLGASVLALAAVGVVATVGFALAAGHLMGQSRHLAILTGGSVAICGASAAMAIAAVLPRSATSDRDLSFTVFGVTLLSTVAMVAYPILAHALGLEELATALFLGATIHDVAQVVGAGFSVSETTGEIATAVKLIRVALLGPFVFLLALALRSRRAPDAPRQPLLPGFVIAFAVLAALNIAGLVPEAVKTALWLVSKWALLAAIAAVGMRTELRLIRDMPASATALILGETALLAVVALAGLALLL